MKAQNRYGCLNKQYDILYTIPHKSNCFLAILSTQNKFLIESAIIIFLVAPVISVSVSVVPGCGVMVCGDDCCFFVARFGRTVASECAS